MSTKQTPKWSVAIDAVLWRHPTQGTYSLTVYDADESVNGVFELDAVVERTALLEATAWLLEKGWSPVARWKSREGGFYRRFRKVAVTA